MTYLFFSVLLFDELKVIIDVFHRVVSISIWLKKSLKYEIFLITVVSVGWCIKRVKARFSAHLCYDVVTPRYPFVLTTNFEHGYIIIH